VALEQILDWPLGLAEGGTVATTGIPPANLGSSSLPVTVTISMIAKGWI
jgi:hypothetical protein